MISIASYCIESEIYVKSICCIYDHNLFISNRLQNNCEVSDLKMIFVVENSKILVFSPGLYHLPLKREKKTAIILPFSDFCLLSSPLK